MGWNESYSGKLRKLVGHQKLIIPSVRAIIQDEYEKVLFIERRGSGRWAMPAGAMELYKEVIEDFRGFNGIPIIK